MADLSERPQANGRLQIVVTGASDGEVAFVQAIEHGRITSCALGRDDAADATLTIPLAEARAIAAGELDTNVAFMRGRVKVVGDMGSLMAVLPLTSSDAYRALVSEVTSAPPR